MVERIAECVAERIAERVTECIAESVAEHIGDRRRVGDGRKMVVDLGRTSEMVAWV